MSMSQPTPRQTPASEIPVDDANAADSGAIAKLKRLDEELRQRLLREPREAPVEPPKPGLMDRLKSMPSRQGAKSLIAIVVALALGWIPLQRLLATTSAEATVNARLINLRAPIDGQVSLVAPTLAVGTEVEPGETLLKLTNARADRGRLDDLRRTINGLHSDMGALSSCV